ncbi:MAG: hypothetical protein QXQ94_10200 [Candidatus Bathyarchaeia archaeon]
MSKSKIGKDVTERRVAIISSPKESKEFEEWKQAREEEREENPKSEVEIKSEVPMEKEPSADEESREYAKLAEEMAQAKLKASKGVEK